LTETCGDELPVLRALIASDDSVVAPRVVDHLVVTATELVRFVALAIERSDRFFVIVRKRFPSLCHRFLLSRTRRSSRR